MAHELVTEVLLRAPEGLSASEAMVLVVIAEAAGTTPRTMRSGQILGPRECVLRRDTILARAHLADRTLRDVYARLADRGLEVRVPIGTTVNGKPVFAHRERATTFRLPELSRGASKGADSANKGADTAEEAADSADVAADSAEQPADSAPRTVREPLEEPSGEPWGEPSDPSDRGRLPSTDPRDLDDVVDRDDVDRMVEVIDARLDFQMDGYEVSTARGMLQRDRSAQSIAAMVNKVVNKIEADRRRRGAA